MEDAGGLQAGVWAVLLKVGGRGLLLWVVSGEEDVALSLVHGPAPALLSSELLLIDQEVLWVALIVVVMMSRERVSSVELVKGG